MFKAYKGNDVDESYTKIQGVWMRLALDENYDSDEQTKSCLDRISLECLGWGYRHEQSFILSTEEKELLNKKFKERYPHCQHSFSFTN